MDPTSDIVDDAHHCRRALCCRAALWWQRIANGPTAEPFERAFAAYFSRKYAVAVPSGAI
ncbi:DegT/DnrJ/EryC1/StrS family aminotransferase [Bradyrhizobium sp. NC92]|uniref:DegT/DnrJ/EryC1/StrS family aminotransferase n=1 Tax=Bradyrhizobium sp. (strain NC92) TaxID=55395 RepID=UPI003905F5E1